MQKNTDLIRHLAKGKLPVYSESPDRRLRFLFGLILGGSLVAAAAISNLQRASVPFLVAVTLGGGIVLAGSVGFRRRQTIVIDGKNVFFRLRTLLGTREWVEPLANYEGILFTSRHISDDSGGYTLYEVVLHHPDPQRRLLIASETREILRPAWESSCRLLKLPALEMDGDRIVARAAANLDQSVRDLVRDRKLEPVPASSLVPPAGITIAENGDLTELTIQGGAVQLETGNQPHWDVGGTNRGASG